MDLCMAYVEFRLSSVLKCADHSLEIQIVLWNGSLGTKCVQGICK